jgi:hypothetical protein
MPGTLGIALTGIQAAQYDPDALAFINAAAIVDTVSRYAINNLVTDMKLNGLWTKMSAVYPMAGGNATSHSYNLKNTAQYQLTFAGGWTHTSTGAKPNGTNAVFGTGLLMNELTVNDTHLSYYSRTNQDSGIGQSGFPIELGANAVISGIDVQINLLIQRNPTFLIPTRVFQSRQYSDPDIPGNINGSVSIDMDVTTGLYIGTRTNSTTHKGYRNGSQIGTTNTATNTYTLSSSAEIRNGLTGAYTARECAFASIGLGLTDSEALTFTSIVQRYQNALSRAIVAIPTVQDLDAQNFLVASGITDSTQAQAVQNLTAGLKYYSLWDKLQAIYPFAGSTSTTQKFNLKSPFDTDAAFRLVFNGGWTHSSTGALPNGTNGYARTHYTPTGNGDQNSLHLSYYSRTTNSTIDRAEFGSYSTGSPTVYTLLEVQLSTTLMRANMNSSSFSGITGTSTNSAAFFLGNRTSSTVSNGWRNGVKLFTGSTTSGANTTELFLCALNPPGFSPSSFSMRECAFASMGEGLTDTEAEDFYTVVQAYQTALSRNV